MCAHDVYVEEDFDFRFQFPFSAVISGPSNSGKTVFVKHLLCNADKMTNVKNYNIIIFIQRLREPWPYYFLGRSRQRSHSDPD